MTLPNLVHFTAAAFVILFTLDAHARTNVLEHGAPTSEAEIPEPLVFDMVRRLNSHQGEFEFNTLFRYEGTEKASGILYAPEFEYAFADGFAGELELPIEEGQLSSVKVALQSAIGTIERGKIENGVQAIYEQELKTAHKEVSILAINGFEFENRISVLSLIGPVVKSEDSRSKWGILANGSIFYDTSREIDVALEINYRKVADELSDLKIIPQFHLLAARDVKFQFGFGTMLVDGEWLALSALRAIWEFND